MKKIIIFLVCLIGTLIPGMAYAKSYSFNYYCDPKQPLDDGTFYMTCHIALQTDYELNSKKC